MADLYFEEMDWACLVDIYDHSNETPFPYGKMYCNQDPRNPEWVVVGRDDHYQTFTTYEGAKEYLLKEISKWVDAASY